MKLVEASSFSLLEVVANRQPPIHISMAKRLGKFKSKYPTNFSRKAFYYSDNLQKRLIL
mgnify:CR=1 FL=1